MIYLDNAATFIVDNKDVLEVFIKANKDYPGNSSSSHRLGYLSNVALDDCRKRIKKALNLNDEYEVIFNSGATEGINLAIKGYALKNITRGNEIICFKNEHPAVLESVKYLESHGFKVNYISPDANGEIDYKELKEKINKNTIMVCAISVNNELGSRNDIDIIYNIVKDYPKCVFFSDVTQSVGKINLNYNHIDMFAFSAHKFGGLIGSGVLIKKKKIQLEKMMHGGAQENNYRSGTVATPLIISSTYALEKAIKNIDANYKYVETLKDEAVKELSKIDEIEINNSSFPYIINFSLKSKKASVVIEALSNKEIYVSSLSACSSKLNKVSYNLLNINKSKQLAENSIRVSFSYMNTIDEVHTFIKELKTILGEIR